MSSAKKRVSTETDASVEAKKARSDNDKGSGWFGFAAYHSERKGERDDMQDAHVIVDDLLSCCTAANRAQQLGRLAYFGVFDGHNGGRASNYAAKHLHTNIAKRLVLGPDLATVEAAMKRCLIEAFKATDDAFLSQASQAKPVWKDGSTATTVLLLNNTLFIANLGDSRAILCRHKPDEKRTVPLVLTKDHNPQAFDERMRIQKAGGVVKDGRILGMLEVSRSLGDGQYKNHGVTCLPDIKKCTLTPNDRCILIGCDGLWKTFNNQDVITFFEKKLAEIRARNDLVATEDRSVAAQQYESVCSELVAEAVRRGSGDNVTVLVVVLNTSS